MKIKHLGIFIIAVFVMFSCMLGAQAKSPVKDSLKQFDEMASALDVNSVIGKPVRSGSSVVIPFARIKFGLGAGGNVAGFGGGSGGKIIPAGLLIIENGKARVELFPIEDKKPSLLEQALPLIIKYLPELMGDKFPGGPKPSKASEQEKAGSALEDVSLDKVKGLFDDNKFSTALEGIEILLAKEPKNAEYHAWKGNIMGSLAGSGNPMDMMKYGMGAMQEFEKAVKLDPENVTAHFGRGISRLKAPKGFGRNYDGAIEDFEFVCKKDPSAESYFYLGESYKGKGLLKKAAGAYKKSLSIKPDHKGAAKAISEIK